MRAWRSSGCWTIAKRRGRPPSRPVPRKKSRLGLVSNSGTEAQRPAGCRSPARRWECRGSTAGPRPPSARISNRTKALVSTACPLDHVDPLGRQSVGQEADDLAGRAGAKAGMTAWIRAAMPAAISEQAEVVGEAEMLPIAFPPLANAPSIGDHRFSPTHESGGAARSFRDRQSLGDEFRLGMRPVDGWPLAVCPPTSAIMDHTPADRPSHPGTGDRFNEEKATYSLRGCGRA